jgi:hypothetical protein
MSATNKNQFYSALQVDANQKKSVNRTAITFWTPVNTFFVGSSLVILLASSTAMFSAIFSSFALSSSSSTFASKAEDSFYATSLPWIQDKSDCEHRGRTWKDGKCWDKEHSPMF